MSRLSAAVVVCTATEEREPLLRACLETLLAGHRVPDETLLVVDQNPSLERSLLRWLPDRVTLLRTERQGNSEARNVGIHAATSDVVAFVDDDATVEPGWLQALMEPFEGPDRTVGVGGAVVPEWGTDRAWLPDELLWTVGCTYRGHREDAGPLRNPIGCNMAFRRAELLAVGGFATEFGKRGNARVICDDTELGLRLERIYGPGQIRYVPAARVRHFVPPGRIGWGHLVRRCITEGLSKGRLQRLYPGAALSAERGYVARLVLRETPRLLATGIVRQDRQSALGGAAILVALAVTSAAFVVGVATVKSPAPDVGGPVG
jgi:cellulose synthase/poly-beta-1,6-N-acetylglucosamine synthase-like glycosyltransferase